MPPRFAFRATYETGKYLSAVASIPHSRLVMTGLLTHLRGLELRLERANLVLQLLPDVAHVLGTRLQESAHLLLRPGMLPLEGRQGLLRMFLRDVAKE